MVKPNRQVTINCSSGDGDATIVLQYDDGVVLEHIGTGTSMTNHMVRELIKWLNGEPGFAYIDKCHEWLRSSMENDS